MRHAGPRHPTTASTLLALPALATLALLLLAAGPATGAQDSRASGSLVPAAPLELVYARPYQVEKPMSFHGRGKTLEVKKGWVLVLKADLRLLQPENAPDYCLFVGDCIGQRINSGYRDGYLVVITPECDLKKTPFWFGGRHLPDRLTRPQIEEEWKAAAQVGITPFDERAIKVACARGGEEVLKARDLNELWYLQRDLILEYAPAEKEMALSLHPGK